MGFFSGLSSKPSLDQLKLRLAGPPLHLALFFQRLRISSRFAGEDQLNRKPSTGVTGALAEGMIANPNFQPVTDAGVKSPVGATQYIEGPSLWLFHHKNGTKRQSVFRMRNLKGIKNISLAIFFMRRLFYRLKGKKETTGRKQHERQKWRRDPPSSHLIRGGSAPFGAYPPSGDAFALDRISSSF